MATELYSEAVKLLQEHRSRLGVDHEVCTICRSLRRIILREI